MPIEDLGDEFLLILRFMPGNSVRNIGALIFSMNGFHGSVCSFLPV